MKVMLEKIMQMIDDPEVKGLLKKLVEQNAGGSMKSSTSTSNLGSGSCTENEGNCVTQVPSSKAPVEAAFHVLLNAVIEVKESTIMFRPLLQRLKSTLDYLLPLIGDMVQCNKALDRPKEELENMRVQMENGVVLVGKCLNVRRWTRNKRYTYINQLFELNDYLQEQLSILLVQIARDVRETSVLIRNIKEVVKRDERSGMAENQLEYKVCCNVSEHPFPTVGFVQGTKDVIMETLVFVKNIEEGVKGMEGRSTVDEVSESLSPTVGIEVLNMQGTKDVIKETQASTESTNAEVNLIEGRTEGTKDVIKETQASTENTNEEVNLIEGRAEEKDIDCAIALSLSELDQKGESVIEDESQSESEDEEQPAKVESEDDKSLAKVESEDDEPPAKVESDHDEPPAKISYEEDDQSAKVQLEEYEQLPVVIQESLNVDSPPRHDTGSIFQPLPFFNPAGNRICAGCKLGIGHGRYLSCVGAVWHPDCFCCHACNLPITDDEFSMSSNHPYHKSCYKEKHHPRCDVCKSSIATNSAGLTEYRPQSSWLQRVQNCHDHDWTLRCCSYEKMEEKDIDCAITLPLSELDQKRESVIEDESQSEDDKSPAKVESEDDEPPAKVESGDDEALAIAIQESLNMDSPPRHDTGSIFCPFPFINPAGNRICAGCKRGIGDGQYLSCVGAVWHPDCFCCHACNLPITDYEFSMSGNHPYHKSCYKEKHHPRCDVCKSYIATNSAGLIEYRAHPFWLQKYCPSHEHDRTPQCCSCERMEPKDTKYLLLDDGRKLCLECLDSAIMDNQECQPLYLEIQEFYEGLNMKVEEQVPVLLVERQALNEAMEGEKNGHHHLPETRGFCLSDERTVTTILRRPKIGAGYRMIDMTTEPYRLVHHHKVTAILVLYGLPRLLTGSIIAREMMRAWLRLKGYPNLSPEVEEGICQVMAHLWLDAEMCSAPGSDSVTSLSSSSSSSASFSSLGSSKKGKQSDFQKQLGDFFKHQIESDSSTAYGEGFRLGNQAVLKYGLRTTLDNIRITGSFPTCRK